MMLRNSILAGALMLASSAMAQASVEGGTAQPLHSRQTVLLAAKNLAITTTKDVTYYYLVSSEEFPTLHLNGSEFTVKGDVFNKAEVRNMRLRSLQRFVLDEDSVTYYRTQIVDHGLVALRRSLQLGKWNSLVLPFDLTARQVTDAFGEETELATPRGIREGDNTVVEFSSIDLTAADEVVMKANNHYLIRPSREADLAEGRTMSNFISGKRLTGPIYFIENVSVKKNATPRLQTIQSSDEATQVRFRGTYLKLDNSVLLSNGRPSNKMVAPGVYMLNDEEEMVLTEDSTAMLAFTSWIEDLSTEPQALKFYIDGVNEELTAIADIRATGTNTMDNGQWIMDNGIYDLSGRKVAASLSDVRNRKGVYVVNGRKYIIK